jgi:hypothetical protein
MFRQRKKKLSPLQSRCRSVVAQEALTLIAVANKAETESIESGDAESTDVQELRRAKAVLAAQTTLTECILLGRSSGLTLREISTELIQPVVDRSVIGDVARLALDHAIRDAERKSAQD